MAVPDTLRGFRTQFLYTLYRVVVDNQPERTYIPEGVEDLDILEGHTTVESIQVKNLKDSLSYSNLRSSGKQTSFFQRGQAVLRDNINAILRLTSFGPIGNQLTEVNALVKALKKDSQIFNADISSLISSFVTEKVDEDVLYDSIIENLKNTFPSFDGEFEIRFLLQWISELAEKQQSLTLTQLHDQLLSFREVESRQKTSQNQLGIRVKRLFINDTIEKSNATLKEEFLKGVSARPSHIQGNVDLRRSMWLNQIDDAFRKQNVLVVHGVSGQGKSSLCYRYIKDFETFGFEIIDCNPSTFEEITATVQEISNGLKSHVLIYFDCQPGDKSWSKLVREFGGDPHVRILVSIREEDWQLSKHLVNEYASYNEISLSLSVEEAYQIFQIYEPLSKKTAFIDKWEGLGENVPLLEFIYSITHGETLKSKLTNQYRSLSSEQQQIVSSIIIPLYLGGEPTEETLLQNRSLNPLTLSTTLSSLEEEYFTKNGTSYSDIHPVRTSILKDIICNGSSEWLIHIGLYNLGRLQIKETSRYIIHLFQEGMNLEDLFGRLDEFDYIPATLCYEVVKALLWKGCQIYILKNASHIDELSGVIGGVWSWMLPINYTDIDVTKSIHDIFKNHQNLYDAAKEISDKMDSQGKVFECIRQWLTNRKIKISQLKKHDFEALGKLLYLLHLEKLTTSIDTSNISIKPATYLRSSEYAYLLLGLKSAEIHKDEWKSLEELFIKIFRDEYHVYSLAFREHEIDSKILIDLRNGFEDEEALKKSRASRFINKRVVRVCELLRMAFPNLAKYACELEAGELGDLMIDRIKTISRQNLPIDLMRMPHHMVCQIYDHERRLENKRRYFEQTISARQQYLDCATTLLSIFKKWIKGESVSKKQFSRFQFLHEGVGSLPTIELPSSFLDPTLIRENEEESTFDQNVPILNYSRLFDKYSSAITSFYNQFLNALTDRTSNQFIPKYHLMEAIKECNNLQQITFILGNPYSSLRDLEKLVKREETILEKLYILWNNLSQNFRHISSPERVEYEWEQRKKSLPPKFVKRLKEAFDNLGYTAYIEYLDREIRIKLLYQNIPMYSYIQESFIYAVSESLPYEYLSTEHVMLTQVIDNITLTESLQVDLCEYSITGVSLRVSMDDAFLLKESQNPISHIKAERNHSDKNIEELYLLEKFQGLLLSMSLTASQIHSAKENIEKSDEDGLRMIDHFTSRYRNLESEFVSQIKSIRHEAEVITDIEVTDELYALCNKIENLSNSGLWLNSITQIKQIVDDISSMIIGYKTYVLIDYIQRHNKDLN